MSRTSKSAFTLIEILVTLGIVAVLSTVVVVTLNPAELIKQARDSTRISDLNTVNTALGTFAADVTSAHVGSSSIVYVSLPDSSPTCANLNLPALQGGWVYSCATTENYKKTDGTGWIPANLSRISFGNPLDKLPIDPKNSTSTGLYYTFVTTGSWWELTAILESDKYGPRMVIDGGASPNAFEQGTNLTLTPVEALDRGVPAGPVAPTIASISPTSTTAGDSSFTLTVIGANFTSSSVVNWGASAKTTSFVSSTQLTASILAGDISATGTIAITVSDPVGGTSGLSNFAINERTQFIAGSWTTDSSAGCSQAAGAAIAEVDGKYYILCGNSLFRKYDPGAQAWTALTNIPSNTGYGSAIVKYNSDTLYAFRQEGSTDFFKYVISTNTWSYMTGAPGPMGAGASLAYPGTGDYIYVLMGAGNNAFWRYSVSNNNWGESGVAQSDGATMVEVDGKYYIFTGGGGGPFRKYDPTTRTWTTLANNPSNTGYGASLVKYNSDTIYAFRQEGSADFFKYVISTNTWSYMTGAPATIGTGASLAYPGTGDYIYALRGNDTTFWQYSVSKNSWNESGETQTNGAAIVEVSGLFYIFNGGNGGRFRKYDPTTRTWTTLANNPSNQGNGAALVKYNSDTIYAFRQEGSADFFKYVISTNTWSYMTGAPATIGTGASLAYPGTGDYIYALKGGSTNTFWRYSVSGNSWDTRAVAPGNAFGGAGLTAVGSDTLYALSGSYTTVFWKYIISTDTWSMMASVPAEVRCGGSLTSDGTNVYAFRGAGAADFWKYTVASNSWATLANSPAIIGDATAGAKGGLAYSPSLNKIFAISGNTNGYANSIFEYDIASGIWPFRGTLPGTAFGGASLVSADADTLYALAGNDSTAFWKYTISTATWLVMATAPAGTRAGSSLTTDGVNIYATRGNGTTSFWKYVIALNSWSAIANTPTGFGNGVMGTRGGIAYSPSLNKIFAISGNSTSYSGTIFEYNVTSNFWVFPEYAPAGVTGGAALTPSNSDTLYAFAGGDTTTFWKYSISTGTWSAKTSAPATTRCGGSLTSDGTNVFALRGNGTTSFWKYTVASDSWSVLAATPGAVGDATFGTRGGLSYSSSLNKIFAIPGSGTSIYKNSQ